MPQKSLRALRSRDRNIPDCRRITNTLGTRAGDCRCVSTRQAPGRALNESARSRSQPLRLFASSRWKGRRYARRAARAAVITARRLIAACLSKITFCLVGYDPEVLVYGIPECSLGPISDPTIAQGLNGVGKQPRYRVRNSSSVIEASCSREEPHFVVHACHSPRGVRGLTESRGHRQLIRTRLRGVVRGVTGCYAFLRPADRVFVQAKQYIKLKRGAWSVRRYDWTAVYPRQCAPLHSVRSIGRGCSKMA